MDVKILVIHILTDLGLLKKISYQMNQCFQDMLKVWTFQLLWGDAWHVLALDFKVKYKLQKVKIRKKENQICPKQNSVWLP